MRHFDVLSVAVIERTGSNSLIHADQRQPLFSGYPSEKKKPPAQGWLDDTSRLAAACVRTCIRCSSRGHSTPTRGRCGLGRLSTAGNPPAHTPDGLMRTRRARLWASAPEKDHLQCVIAIPSMQERACASHGSNAMPSKAVLKVARMTASGGHGGKGPVGRVPAHQCSQPEGLGCARMMGVDSGHAVDDLSTTSN
jgi:hypothetical protein